MDGGRRALEAADTETDQPGTPGSKEREQAAKVLRTFLETFVSEEFLPEVYVNFRWGSLPILFATLACSYIDGPVTLTDNLQCWLNGPTPQNCFWGTLQIMDSNFHLSIPNYADFSRRLS